MSRSRQEVFLQQVIDLCFTHNGSITSWIRTPQRNQLVGGHPESKHLSGNAVDIVLDRPTGNDKLMTAARKLGLTAINEGDHIHIQLPRIRQ